MKPYKIIKTQQSFVKPVVVNKLKETKVPLKFFKSKNPYVKNFIIEAPIGRQQTQDLCGHL